MKRLTLATAAALAIAGLIATPSIIAQNAPAPLPGEVDSARVAAGTYALDPSHTLVSWEVDHFGFNDYIGLFGDINGTMTIDPAAIEKTEFEIMIPIAKVSVASQGLKDHLLRPGKDGGAPDFFGPEPGMATFKSVSVTKLSETIAGVSGMLTMNGKSNPVTLRVEFTGAGTNPYNKKQTIGFHANATIDRTKWGINYGVPFVGKDVDLKISAAFEKQ
jgi:polyisoprenoid-binding protein YceI